jgi:hypothetical protein
MRTELLAGNGEWGAGNAAGQEVDSRILARIPELAVGYIAVRHLPVRAVTRQGLTCVTIDLYGERVLEAGALQADGLTSCTCTDLNYLETHRLPL